MTQNEGELWLFEIAIADVQVGPAYAARANLDQDLSIARAWDREVARLEGLIYLLEHHGVHIQPFAVTFSGF